MKFTLHDPADAEDRHPVGVATEGRDVPLDPLEGRDLIEYSVISRRMMVGFLSQLGMRKVAEWSQAVVDRHRDDPLPGQVRSPVRPHGSGFVLQAPAVKPDHYRPFLVRRFRRGPHVEVQAILVLFGWVAPLRAGPHGRGRVRDVDATETPFRGLANALPGLDGLWGSPPTIADRRRGIRDAPEYANSRAHRPRNRSTVDIYDGKVLAGSPATNNDEHQRNTGQGAQARDSIGESTRTCRSYLINRRHQQLLPTSPN